MREAIKEGSFTGRLVGIVKEELMNRALVEDRGGGAESVTD